MLLRDILLAVSRITDPAQTGRKHNLILERLAIHIDQSTHPSLKAEIEHDLAEAKNRCSFARDSRNRLIAHNDLSTILQGQANSLPAIKKKEIEGSLQIICEIMNKVERYFEGIDTCFEVTEIDKGAGSLLACLRQAKAYREQRGR